MKFDFCRFRAAVWAALSLPLLMSLSYGATPPAAPPSPNCDAVLAAAPPVVTSAVNMRSGGKSVSLGEIVSITGTNLEKLFDKACAGREVVLFLEGWPLSDVKPKPPVDPSTGTLHFKLVNRHYDEGTSDPWLPILGSPGFKPVTVKASVGFANGYAMPPMPNGQLPTLELIVLPPMWLLLWAAIFIGMVLLFWYLVRHTTILRDPGPNGLGGVFSLSRSQGALWFFIILAAYLFIGIVTGDFSSSINSTALILLGIGAGTVLGSAAIDAQKDASGSAPKIIQSGGYLDDILSDANGISFHRFQMAAWTVVLSIIFAIEVYRNLAMPTFNTTLMGLLGLSAGTYLGLKIPEATTPAKGSK
jgi:hypothetical protein